jgi:gamma-glutamyltranspeptidase/glutathione hydrolase
LEQGGNAADAGVAAGLCINVLEPELAHFGGVAPIIYCPGRGGPVETISGLGRWPQAASADYFRQHYGGDMPENILRTVTPAAADAWLSALARWGTMSFEQVVAPALELAGNGRPVDPRCHEALSQPEMTRWPSTEAVFRPGGRVPQVGEFFRQPDLARTFERMVTAERRAGGSRETGIRAARDLIYKGEIAREIAAFHQAQGSWLTYEDLAGFAVRLEAPERINYKGYEVFSCGAWCQGPTLLMVLKLLEGVDLRGMGWGTADYLHTLLEAIKLVFADREAYFGDPDFVIVPLANLLSEGYAARRRGMIDGVRAVVGMAKAGEMGGEGPKGARHFTSATYRERPVWESDTSYVCVVDEWGNAFSATPSDGLTSTPVVPGLGFAISGRGMQSWLDEAHPSSLQPGKRPRLTPNPSLILKEGKPFMPLGCPGGDAQVQAMLQVFLNIVEFGMAPQAAIEAPRVISHSFPNSFWPHQIRPGEVTAESRWETAILDELRQRGHVIIDDGEWSSEVARVCTIVVDGATGVRTAGADPRSTAYAVAW